MEAGSGRADPAGHRPVDGHDRAGALPLLRQPRGAGGRRLPGPARRDHRHAGGRPATLSAPGPGRPADGRLPGVPALVARAPARVPAAVRLGRRRRRAPGTTRSAGTCPSVACSSASSSRSGRHGRSPCPPRPTCPTNCVAQLAAFSTAVGGVLPLGALAAYLSGWVRLYGGVTIEVFGHLGFALTDAEPMFEAMLADMRRQLDDATALKTTPQRGARPESSGHGRDEHEHGDPRRDPPRPGQASSPHWTRPRRATVARARHAAPPGPTSTTSSPRTTRASTPSPGRHCGRWAFPRRRWRRWTPSTTRWPRRWRSRARRWPRTRAPPAVRRRARRWLPSAGCAR